jgi:hypothetical protein
VPSIPPFRRRLAAVSANQPRSAEVSAGRYTFGLLLGVIVHPADVQDRDGAEPLLRQARRL